MGAWILLAVFWIGPAWGQEPDPEKIATAFTTGACEGYDRGGVSVSAQTDDVLGRPVYTVRTGLRSADGPVGDVTAEIHAGRLYVTNWYVDLWNVSADSGGATIQKEEALRIAREFVATRFPNWGEELSLVSVYAPPDGAAGTGKYVCKWEGTRDGVRSGDWVIASVDVRGQVTVYLCNAAVMHTFESVSVLKARAVELARESITARATFDMQEVTLAADMVLSHPLAPDEGPVWEVTATRPPPLEGWSARVLTLYFDAVNAEPVRSALGELIEEYRYFYSN